MEGMPTIWACPVCGGGLERAEQSLRCPNRHTYDLSAKGYVNLMLANQRKSKDPGDSKAMLAARRNILNAGYFGKLSDALSTRIAELARELSDRGEHGQAFTVLDAGCGEGYYLESLDAALRRTGLEAALYGIDISRDAVTMAASAGRGIGYAVASSRKLPVRTASADAILQIFAPHSDSEFARVLRCGGHLLTVIPGKHHLYGLKEELYDKPYWNDEAEHPYPSFRVLDRVRLRDDIVLTGRDAIRDLVMMTPYYWKTEPAMLDKLMGRQELHTPLEFIVTAYAKA